MTRNQPKIGCWLAAPDVVFIEIAADLAFDTLVLDVEHGTLSLADLDKLIPLARALKLEVLVKVAGPQAEPIQQALDFGANGVVIPHVGSVAHATAICRSAKYPMLGTRSYAGARSVRYGAPSAGYFEDDNRETACYPMIETAEALADVEAILALPTVGVVLIGPSDLSLTRGRGRYRFCDADGPYRPDSFRLRRSRESPGSCRHGPQQNEASPGIVARHSWSSRSSRQRWPANSRWRVEPSNRHSRTRARSLLARHPRSGAS